MSRKVAERKLLFSLNDEDVRQEVVVEIFEPYLVRQDMVDFQIAEGTSACEVSIVGLPEEFSEITYGADRLQALQLSADVEPLLKRLSKKYNFYFTTGEPYFEN